MPPVPELAERSLAANAHSSSFTHFATRHALVHGLVGLFAIYVVLAADAPRMLFAVALYLATVIWMARLTVCVGEDEVTWWFGLGLPYWSLPTAAIVRCDAVRGRWFHGSGVRRTRRGWLFHAGGVDAVEIEDSAGRVRRIGTDKPQALAAAVSRAMIAAEKSTHRRLYGPARIAPSFGHRTTTA